MNVALNLDKQGLGSDQQFLGLTPARLPGPFSEQLIGVQIVNGEGGCGCSCVKCEQHGSPLIVMSET